RTIVTVLRRLSTPRLLFLLGTLAAAIAAVTVVAVAATGGAGASPTGEPLAQAVDDALAAPPPQGLDARVTFPNNLPPPSSLPGVVANQAAYTVSVSPKENGGLFGDAQLAWAASNGVPLRIAVTAKGDSTPVLELKVTDISFGSVDPADVAITPPAGAKIVELTPPSSSSSGD